MNELYIMALEESAKQKDGNSEQMTGVGNSASNNMIGGGQNLPDGFGNQVETMATSTIPDEVLEENSRQDYGAMYSQVKPDGGFKTIEKE